MSAGESLNVAAEIAGLRGAMNTGFAKIEGQLALIAQQGADVREDVTSLEARVTALEARRWPLAPMAAVSGATSAVVAVAALFLTR